MQSHIDLEQALSKFTGAPFIVLTDCCTHAIEVCLRLKRPEHITMTAFTYLSVIMVMEKLNLTYTLTDEQWMGEYNLGKTNIWDSARLLSPNMFRKGQMQCLSFGHTKPVDNKRGGAILLDSYNDYIELKKMCNDGRDLQVVPWEKQKQFSLGFHYNMPFEHAKEINVKLAQYIKNNNYTPIAHDYPDCRNICIT
jgi:dTDP-4-amino-4,6-dideoxygalactose transaminase